MVKQKKPFADEYGVTSTFNISGIILQTKRKNRVNSNFFPAANPKFTQKGYKN